MNKAIFAAFIGGAAAGAIAALLLAPKKGNETRAQIKDLCRKYGLCKNKAEQEVDRLVDEIAEEIALAERY
ncbi:MAG: YtxH domain-containing protein [Bacteroidales bacterium]|nr:YtxH domain-containing protein [Bacteroidales bacterium]